jgi:hypothetical protein
VSGDRWRDVGSSNPAEKAISKASIFDGLVDGIEYPDFSELSLSLIIEWE